MSLIFACVKLCTVSVQLTQSLAFNFLGLWLFLKKGGGKILEEYNTGKENLKVELFSLYSKCAICKLFAMYLLILRLLQTSPALLIALLSSCCEAIQLALLKNLWVHLFLQGER